MYRQYGVGPGKLRLMFLPPVAPSTVTLTLPAWACQPSGMLPVSAHPVPGAAAAG